MRLICSKRDCYDYLLVSRDQRERVYKRNPVLMLDLKEAYFSPISKTHNFHQLASRDATLYLYRLVRGYYGMFSSKAAFGRYDRIHVIVVGSRLFILVKRDLDKKIEDITAFLKDASFDLYRLATLIRREVDIGPLVGVTGFGQHEMTSYIPYMADLLKIVNMTNEEVVQELENAMIADNPDPAMPDISDKDRIVQHGFDLKTSFRKVK